MDDVVCRPAVIDDVEGITKLIAHYAALGIMLPRSRETILRHWDSFVVAVADAHVIGCGSLTRLGADLVEIRSLGLDVAYKGRGLGRQLITQLICKAQMMGISTVMALTYEVDFFLRNGFVVVHKEIFPEKVWRDCIHCPKQHQCDEIAVVRKLDIKPPAEG